TITNNSNVTLTNITLNDPQVAVTGGPIASLAPGLSDNTTFSATYTLTQANIDAGVFVNTATVTGKDPNSNDVTHSDSHSQPLPAASSISMTKTGTVDADVIAPNGVVNAGDHITYSFTVTNTGNTTLTDVMISDPQVTITGGPIASLAPGITNSSTFTATYLLTQADIDAGTYTNLATATGMPPSGPPVTGSDDDSRSLPAASSISLIKTGTLHMDIVAPNGIANAGDKITYAFTVTNTGNTTLTNVTISDPLATILGGPIASLAPGATNSNTFTATHTLVQGDIDAGTYYNLARASGNPPSGPPVTNVDDDTQSFGIEASIHLLKTGTPNFGPDGIPQSGETISYAFVVNNTGNVTLSNVYITDPLATVSGGPVSSLAPGVTDNTTFTAVYTLTQADIDAGTFTNTATVFGTTPFSEGVSDDDDDTQLLARQPQWTLHKVASESVYHVIGDVLHYTLSVANTGNASISNVVLTDPGADAGSIQYISGDIGGDLILSPGETWLYHASHAVVLADLNAGHYFNMATVNGIPAGGVLAPAYGTADVPAIPHVIIANDDDASLSPVNGYTGGTAVNNVLDNDLLNGLPVNPLEVVITALNDPSDGVTLNTATGEVTVAPGTPAGTYYITYQICEILNPTNCDPALVTVVVSAAPIIANDDDASLSPVNGYTGGTAVNNVLDNDLLNGLPVNPLEVVITALSDPSDGVTLNTATGEVTVAPGTPAGTYYITYQICEILNPTNCDPALVTVVVYQCPVILSQPAGTAVCYGGTHSMTINANSGSGTISYQWQRSSAGCETGFLNIDGATDYSYTTPTLNSTGYYRCIVTSSIQQCQPVESSCATVIVNPLPIAGITPGGPTTFCQGGSVILTATGGTSYLWSNTATTAAITVSSSGTYSVTVTNANGCSNETAATVIVNPLPTAVITPNGPTTFCQGGSVVLTASGGTSYLWSNAATTAAITVSSGGTYTVTATNANGCSNTVAATVTVNPLPVAVITPNGPTTFCQGGSVILTASGGTSYLWSNGATTAAITVTSSGTSTVMVTNANGCSNIASTIVTVNPLPIASITPNGPTTFCQGGSVTLTASGGTGYLWSNAATNAAIIVSSSGTYFVTVTNANGCSNETAATVIVNPLPTAVITPNGPVTFCQGGSVTLTASGGTGYLWSNAATTAAITVSASGIYTVTATNANGCSNTTAATVTVNPLPVAVITPNGPTTFCQGGSVILTASGGTSYLWSNAATTAAITVSASGTYSVTVTNANGCSNSTAATVTVNPLPVGVITPNGPVTFCQGGSVILTASGGTGYLWSTAATTSAITVSASGTYTVTVTNENGCSNTTSAQVTVNPLPAPVITPNGPTTFCQGGSVILTASGGTGYLWSNAATTSAITVSASGTYTVTVTNSNGCSNTNSAQVTVNPLPTPVITPNGPTTFCQGGSVTLTASGGTGYLWSNAATTAAITVSASGTYSVTVTNANGCSNSTAATVTVNPLPTAVITPNGPTTFCQGGSVVLTASGGTGYLWSNAATTAAITVSSSGTYTVTVTNANGCSNSAAIPVTVNPLPAAFSVVGTGSYCIGEPGVLVGLSGSQPGIDYTLVPGGIVVPGTGNAISFGIQVAGTYTVSAINTTTNCTALMNGFAFVTTNPKPTLVVTNPAAVCAPGTANLTDPAVTAGSTLFGAQLSYWMDANATVPMPTPATAGDGTYYIKATTSAGCYDIKPVKVTVNPRPILVTNPQSVCSPARVDLTSPAVTAGSTLSGAVLSYWTNAAATIPMATPTLAGNGTYYIKATSASGCFDIKPVTVTINPLPTVYLGTGGGSYCAAGSGMVLGISGSQIGVNYSLWIGVTQVSPTIPGTGGPVSFGLQSLEGYYWVLAENATTHCINRMFDCVQIVIDPQLPVSVLISTSANPVVAGSAVTFTASPVNGGPAPSYQWKVNGFNAGANLPAFTYVPVNHDEVTCVVTSNLPCVSGNPAQSNTIVMTVAGIAANIVVTGNVNSGETKCYNASQTMTVAGGGTTFIVNPGGSATMIASQNIIYLPGTRVQPGGYMHGYISGTYCGQKSETLVTTATGEEEQLSVASPEVAFKLYPNPTSGNFTIEQTGAKFCDKVSVALYGMHGEKLMTGELLEEKKHEFSIADLMPGLYFVKIVADGYAETLKIVKTR
ncbi:MAG: T9SS type A sorting domain-containing protein, partial [Bacteroidetes bacterium]|nr:T9SS type A sorting domain-containing protein [Bacteroidota bacterium]